MIYLKNTVKQKEIQYEIKIISSVFLMIDLVYFYLLIYFIFYFNDPFASDSIRNWINILRAFIDLFTSLRFPKLDSENSHQSL